MFEKIGDRIINVVSFGAGDPPFFAVGGWIGTWQVWRQTLEILSEDRRCVAYDHRGSGQSLADVSTLNREGLVDDVFLILDHLGIEDCWLGGESQGGFIATCAYLRDPARFRGLVIIDSTPHWDPNDSRRLAFADALEKDLDAALGPFVGGCIPEEDAKPHLRRWLFQILKEAEPEYGPALLRQMDVDIRDRLAEVQCPTLVVHGLHDVMEPPESGRMFAEGIPGARWLGLEGVGHVPTITRSNEVASAIRSLIADAEAAYGDRRRSIKDQDA
ncbi:MAG: alpha/beta fold hydrolase [Pseudomonadota bacterium]